MPLQALALVGATGTGKTAIAGALAGRGPIEVVCADSRQVFRELDIGTGKPTPEQRRARPHHLFDALTLEERPSAGWYARRCAEACQAIAARGHIPLLVGGSGLYLKAARHGLSPVPPIDAAVHESVLRSMAEEGPEALHQRLSRLDPERAARVHVRDRQRIARALEVVLATGRPAASWHDRAGPPAADAWRVVEVRRTPAALRGAIAVRTRDMFAHGLMEETRALVEAGRGPALRALRAIGYDEALDSIETGIDLERACLRVDLRTAQLAKRQRTWFRHQPADARIDLDALSFDAAVDQVAAVLIEPARGGG